MVNGDGCHSHYLDESALVKQLASKRRRPPSFRNLAVVAGLVGRNLLYRELVADNDLGSGTLGQKKALTISVEMLAATRMAPNTPDKIQTFN